MRRKTDPKTGKRTLCEPAQSKCTSTCHKSRFIQKFTGKMPLARTATQTLCEPEQSKRITRFHKSHFIQKFTGKYDGAQNRDPNFVRACAVETQVKISQEPLYMEIGKI